MFFLCTKHNFSNGTQSCPHCEKERGDKVTIDTKRLASDPGYWAEWVGGLPPVGRECEVHMHGDQWSKARVVGHDEEGGIPSAVCRVLDSYYAFSKKCVRPLRTKEQRQRDGAVRKAAHAIAMKNGSPITLYLKYCEDLYDAGLLRLEPKDA